MKKVVIIGGGYAGSLLAKQLDASYDVTLIDKRPVFFHKIASLRAAVDEQWTTKPFVTRDKLLKRGKVLIAEATDILPKQKQILLKDKTKLPYDYAVIATGSEYQLIAQFAGDTQQDAERHLSQTQKQIAQSRTIAIVGGGPVGIELAGEITHLYTDKQIALISSRHLVSHLPQKVGDNLAKQLQARGVNLILNQSVTPKSLGGVLKSHDFASKPDLVIWTTGTRVNTDWLAKHHPEWIADCGIKTDQYLRVQGQKDIFAIGDVAHDAGTKTVLSLEKHIQLTADNLRAIDAGQPLKPLQIPTLPMVVPIGPKAGATFIPTKRGGIVAGKLMTSAVKGKSLFVSRFRGKMGIKNG